MARRSVAVAVAAVPQPPLSISKCEATAPDTIVVTFSEPVDVTTPGGVPSSSARDPANYSISLLSGPGTITTVPTQLTASLATIQPDRTGENAIIKLSQNVAGALTLAGGQWIQIEVKSVTTATA